MYGELSAIGMAICFSFSFVLTRKIERNTTPLFNNTFRSIVGAICFSLVSLVMGLFSGIRELPLNLWVLIFSSIFFNVVIGDTIYLYGQQKIGPANASAIGTVYPIVALGLEYFFLNRNIGAEVVWAALIAGAGVIYLANVEKEKTTPSGEKLLKSDSVKGIISVILAATAWAVGTVLTDISLRRSEELLHQGTNITNIIFALRYLFAAAAMIGWSLLQNRRKKGTPKPLKLNRSIWIIAFIAALLAGYIGSYFNGEAARTVGAAFAGIVQTSLPVIILPLNYLINHEKSSFKEIIGNMVIISGVSLLFIF